MVEEAEEAPPVQIMYVVEGVPNNLKEVYAAKAASVLGFVLLFCAVLTFICGIIEQRHLLEFGIFAIFLLTGGITLAGAMTGTKCLVIGTMILSIISSLCGGYGTFLAIDYVGHEMIKCQEITELVGDMKMDTPYFMNKNENYTRFDDDFYEDFGLEKYDGSICNQTRPETGAEDDHLNGTYIGRSHPCYVMSCSSLHHATTILLLVSSLIAIVGSVVIAGLTCRVTCCYTPPPGAKTSVVFTKTDSYEADVGQYKEL